MQASLHIILQAYKLIAWACVVQSGLSVDNLPVKVFPPYRKLLETTYTCVSDVADLAPGAVTMPRMAIRALCSDALNAS